MTTIGVVFGGPSPEHDVSVLTGLQAARALAQAGDDVLCLYWTKSGAWMSVPVSSEASAFLEPDPPGSARVDLSLSEGFVEHKRRRSAPLDISVILNCCHGGPGEDGTLAGLLALSALSVTGPSGESAALVMDKLATAALAMAIGVPCVPTVLLDGSVTLDTAPPTPWVVKPRFGGSSLGVESGIEDLDTARDLARAGVSRAGALLQPYLRGWTDLNIAARWTSGLEMSKIERPLRSNEGVLSYHDKYLSGTQGMASAPRELPAAIPDEIATRIGEYAGQVMRAFGLTGAPRLDFLWDGKDDVRLCEVNAIPGAWATYLWAPDGVAPVMLYRALIDEALKAPKQRSQWSGSSDGRALRVAGSIASKLVGPA